MKYINDLMDEFEIFKDTGKDHEKNPFNEDELDDDCYCDCNDEEEVDFEEEGEECHCDCADGEQEQEQEKNFQGTIRTVKGANLVYKRKSVDGDFEELWVYNVGKNIKHSNGVKRAILAGTDIEPEKMESDNGEQVMSITTTGNVQFIKITGLPN